jgi:Zn-dependent protease
MGRTPPGGLNGSAWDNPGMESQSHSPQSPIPAPGAGGAPAHYPPTYTPEPAQRETHWKRFGGFAAAAALLVFKFGKVALLALTKVKFLTTSFSALISVAAYALFWGWAFAVGFVVLMFVHEMGHVIQLRREGIKASAPMFIPFLGAAVFMKELPKDAGAEARVGLAGPILGTVGCLAVAGLWLATGDPFFEALAYTGFLLNLFNLIPMVPLDGGRAMAALAPWMWLVGFAAMIALLAVTPNPILLIIVLFGAFETYHRWKQRKDPEAQRYHEVTARTRWLVALTYVGLVVGLAVAMELTYLPMSL